MPLIKEANNEHDSLTPEQQHLISATPEVVDVVDSRLTLFKTPPDWQEETEQPKATCLARMCCRIL